MAISRHEGIWEVRFHDDFAVEFGGWAAAVQDALYVSVLRLRTFGPTLGRPLVDTLKASNYSNMKEIRVDADGGVWRVAFAFDRKRRAILLTGGNKTGMSKERFYLNLIRIADQRYGQYLSEVTADRRK